MKTDCNPKQLHFQGLRKRDVVAAFNGGTISSDAGALLLREVETARARESRLRIKNQNRKGHAGIASPATHL
jgi:hypothetical protein